MGLPLMLGQHGPEIADLRRRLARWQRDQGEDSELGAGESFDGATADTVRNFQRARNLPADAIVGPETWQALVEANYQLGDRLLWHSGSVMRGDDVLDLQHRLNQLGFDAGTEDGLFGPQVRGAVMEFQANVGLDVDGVVGAATLEALRRLHRGHLAEGVGTRVREAAAVKRVARQGVVGLKVMIDAVDPPQTSGADQPVAPADVELLPWAIATRLAGRLSAQGASTMLSRGAHHSPTPSERAKVANQMGVDLVLSIGLNRSSTPSARGSAAYYFGSLRFVSEAGRSLATSLLDGMIDAGFGPDCRVHPMTWTLLRETRMPAVVVEPGFATNTEDVARLRDPAAQERLVTGLCDGVIRFLRRYQAG